MKNHMSKKVKKYPTKSFLPLITAPEKMYYNGREIPFVPLIIVHDSDSTK